MNKNLETLKLRTKLARLTLAIINLENNPEEHNINIEKLKKEEKSLIRKLDKLNKEC